MKQKTGRKLLGFLLALAMAVGLLPGMSLTARAEDTLTIDDLVTAVGTSTFNYSTSSAYTVQVVEGKLMNVNPWVKDEARDLTYNSSDGEYHLKFGSYDNDWYIVIDSNNYITSFMFDNGGTYESYSGKSQFALNISAPTVAVTGVNLNPPTAPLTVGDDAVALTATVEPNNATDKKVKWSVGGDNAGAVALYSDQACTQQVGPDATDKLTVYAKGISAGNATVTATSNADETKSAVCVVTVSKADPVYVTPTGLSAFVGQTLADVALPTADNGTWSWEEDTTAKLNDIGMTTYHAKFTPNDTDKYNIIENIEVQIQVTEKPFAVPATVTANSRTYDGTEKPLVTVTGEATGGTMQYALGTKDAATGTYSASIPTATNAGTYYVWYKVAGDANHNDSEARCVTSTIAKKAEPEPTPDATVARAARPSTQASPSKGAIDVSWKAASGAKSYQVQWRKAGASKWTTKTVRGRKYTITGLRRGTAYQVRVRGVAGSAKGDWSKASSRWLKAASKVRAATGKKSGTVKVSWARDAKANAGCRVYVYARRGSKPIKTIEVGKGKAAATIKGLKAGKTYFVRVRPYRKTSGTTFSGAISGYRTVRAAG